MGRRGGLRCRERTILRDGFCLWGFISRGVMRRGRAGWGGEYVLTVLDEDE